MSTIKLKPVDAIVVGTGICGSIIAMELANAGLKVVGLERGRMINPQHDFAMPYFLFIINLPEYCCSIPKFRSSDKVL